MMLSEILTSAFFTSLFSGMLRITTPILFGATGLVVTNRSGILNLGVEGAMLMGSFVGFLVAYQSGSLWQGVFMAAVGGGIVGLLMAFMSVTLRVNQTVAGLAINLLFTGVTLYLYRIIFADFSGSILPNVEIFQAVHIPGLSEIPVIGEVVFSQQILTYIGFLFVPLVFYFLYRTKYGLILRCIGENPAAIDMKGVNISAYRYGATIFGGMMAGVGGVFLTVASAGLFMQGITGGRGWIVIAIVIFGDWKPVRIMLLSMFFGLIDSFSLQLQGVGINFPYQFLLTLPYVFTILGITLGGRRAGAPLALGVHYSRE